MKGKLFTFFGWIYAPVKYEDRLYLASLNFENAQNRRLDLF